MAGVSANNTTACSEYWGTEDVEIKIWLIGLFATGVALIGVAENIFLTILFVRNAALRSSHQYYLAILALMDALMGCSYVALMTVQVVMDYYVFLWLYHLWLKYFLPMYTASMVIMTASSYLLVAATLERFLKLVTIRVGHGRHRRPFGTDLRKWLERHRPLVALGIIVFAVLFRGSAYFELKVQHAPECAGLWTEYEVSPTDLVVENLQYRLLWMFYLRHIFGLFVPFVGMLVMNGAILVSLSRQRRRRFSVKADDATQTANAGADQVVTKATLKEATRILLCVACMYLITNVLNVVLYVWEVVDKKNLLDYHRTFYSYSSDIVSILTIVSSASRLPIYCLCNRPIKLAASLTIKRMCCRKRLGGQSSALGGSMLSVVQQNGGISGATMLVQFDDDRRLRHTVPSTNDTMTTALLLGNDQMDEDNHHHHRLSEDNQHQPYCSKGALRPVLSVRYDDLGRQRRRSKRSSSKSAMQKLTWLDDYEDLIPWNNSTSVVVERKTGETMEDWRATAIVRESTPFLPPTVFDGETTSQHENRAYQRSPDVRLSQTPLRNGNNKSPSFAEETANERAEETDQFESNQPPFRRFRLSQKDSEIRLWRL